MPRLKSVPTQPDSGDRLTYYRRADKRKHNPPAGPPALGGELVALYLLKAPALAQHITAYTGAVAPEVEKFASADGSGWLNKGQTCGFRGVPEDVWNFHIGRYQVCEKWLKDRRGRVLSAENIEHYHRVVKALASRLVSPPASLISTRILRFFNVFPTVFLCSTQPTGTRMRKQRPA
jgi:hypothetical protein